MISLEEGKLKTKVEVLMSAGFECQRQDFFLPGRGTCTASIHVQGLTVQTKLGWGQ